MNYFAYHVEKNGIEKTFVFLKKYNFNNESRHEYSQARSYLQVHFGSNCSNYFGFYFKNDFGLDFQDFVEDFNELKVRVKKHIKYG